MVMNVIDVAVVDEYVRVLKKDKASGPDNAGAKICSLLTLHL